MIDWRAGRVLHSPLANNLPLGSIGVGKQRRNVRGHAVSRLLLPCRGAHPRRWPNIGFVRGCEEPRDVCRRHRAVAQLLWFRTLRYPANKARATILVCQESPRRHKTRPVSSHARDRELISPLFEGRLQALHCVELLPWRGGLCRGHVALDRLGGGIISLATTSLVEHGIVHGAILQVQKNLSIILVVEMAWG